MEAYDHHRVLLIEQVVSQALASRRESSTRCSSINRSQSIREVQAQGSLQPADGRLSQCWQLAEESDKGEE